MTSIGNRVAKLFTQTHAAVYRLSKGRVAGKMGGQSLVLLTTTGRRSGEARTSPVMSFPHGDGLVVIASNGGQDRPPSWYVNLSADPSVTVQLGEDVKPMSARTATPQERAEIWPRVVARAKNFAGYEKKTSRLIPVVILTPR